MLQSTTRSGYQAVSADDAYSSDVASPNSGTGLTSRLLSPESRVERDAASSAAGRTGWRGQVEHALRPSSRGYMAAIFAVVGIHLICVSWQLALASFDAASGAVILLCLVCMLLDSLTSVAIIGRRRGTSISIINGSAMGTGMVCWVVRVAETAVLIVLLAVYGWQAGQALQVEHGGHAGSGQASSWSSAVLALQLGTVFKAWVRVFECAFPLTHLHSSDSSSDSTAPGGGAQPRRVGPARLEKTEDQLSVSAMAALGPCCRSLLSATIGGDGGDGRDGRNGRNGQDGRDAGEGSGSVLAAPLNATVVSRGGRYNCLLPPVRVMSLVEDVDVARANAGRGHGDFLLALLLDARTPFIVLCGLDSVVSLCSLSRAWNRRCTGRMGDANGEGRESESVRGPPSGANDSATRRQLHCDGAVGHATFRSLVPFALKDTERRAKVWFQSALRYIVPAVWHAIDVRIDRLTRGERDDDGGGAGGETRDGMEDGKHVGNDMAEEGSMPRAMAADGYPVWDGVSHQVRFARLVALPSEHDVAIRRDTCRTYADGTFFGQARVAIGEDIVNAREGDAEERLFQLLHATAVAIPAIGYCQGMNYVASIVDLVFDDPGDAFAVFVALLKSPAFDLAGLFVPGLPRSRLLFFQLDRLIAERLPHVRALFANAEVDTSMFASDWVLNLFSSCDRVCLRVVLGVWDHFMLRGWSVVLQVSLVIIASSVDEFDADDDADLSIILPGIDAASQRIVDAEAFRTIAERFTGELLISPATLERLERLFRQSAT